MAAKAQQFAPVRWDRCRGRNDFDSPNEVADDMAVSAHNIVLVRGQIGQKRRGSDPQTFTGTSFTGYNHLMRFVPGQSLAAAELLWVTQDSPAKIMRVSAGASASSLTLANAIASLPQNAHHAVINGKLYIAYDSGVNRLHVFDPRESTTTIRMSGLGAPAAPTATNGGGAGVAVLRYYRVQGLVKSGANVRRESNLGTAVSFTPAANGVTVTQPTFVENETHWRVYGSADGDLYYLLSGDIAVATTTFLDNDTPSTYGASHEAAPAEGAFTPWPSVKFLCSTGERLLGFGAWETSTGTGMPPVNGRVWWSPVRNSSEMEDDERVSNTLSTRNYIDISNDAGSEDRAIVGPMDGQIFCFTSSGMFMLVPTSNVQKPYRRIEINTGTVAVGAVNQWSSFVGEDESGHSCVYFIDPNRGHYRYGAGGLQWCGYDNQTLWSTVNLDATNRVAIGEYDPQRRRCVFAFATGSSNDPDTALYFQVREGRPTNIEGVRGGWTTADGPPFTARTMCMFSETIGATMARRLKPYFGLSGALLRGESATLTTDNGTPFQGYALSKAWNLQPFETKKKLGQVFLQSGATQDVDIRLTLIRNYGDTTNRVSDLDLSPHADETRTLRRFSDADLNEAWTFQVQIGDKQAVASSWQLDRVLAEVEPTSERVGNDMP